MTTNSEPATGVLVTDLTWKEIIRLSETPIRCLPEGFVAIPTYKYFWFKDAQSQIAEINTRIKETGYMFTSITHDRALQECDQALKSIRSWMVPTLNGEGRFLRYHRQFTNGRATLLKTATEMREGTYILVELIPISA